MSVSVSPLLRSDDILDFLRQHGDSLWDTQSMIAELQGHWLGDQVSFALLRKDVVPAPSKLRKRMYLRHKQKLQHRISRLSTQDNFKVAELQAWVNLAHPRLFGTAQARELATSDRPLADVLIYGLGARRHTLAVEPIVLCDEDGDQFAIEVRAWLTLGRPIARVQERIYAAVVGGARPRLRAAAAA